LACADRRGAARARPADLRPASSPLGPSARPRRPALSSRRDPGGHRQRSQRRLHGVHRVRSHVQARRPRGPAAARRDGVRERHRGDERVGRLRPDARGGGNRRHRRSTSRQGGRRGPRRPDRRRRRPVPRHSTGRRVGCRRRRPRSSHQPGARPVLPRRFPGRLRPAGPAPVDVRGVALSPADPRRHGAGPCLSRHHHRPESLRRPARRRPVCRPARRGVRAVAHGDRRAGHLPERRGQARRDQHGDERLRLARTVTAAGQPGAGRGHPALLRRHDREIRRRSLHVRVELPRGQGELQLHGALELVQASDRGLLGGREGQALPRHRGLYRLADAEVA
jgi:hypothetical protein